MVYGSSLEAAEELRDPENPKLLAIMDPTKSETEQRCALLPRAGGEAFCRSPNTMDKPCFKAGDERVNENQGKRLRKKSLYLAITVLSLWFFPFGFYDRYRSYLLTDVRNVNKIVKN